MRREQGAQYTVGVILCDGDEWKQTIKVCLERFATSIISPRVAGKMERNSMQNNHCSSGYVESTFLEFQVRLIITVLQEPLHLAFVN